MNAPLHPRPEIAPPVKPVAKPGRIEQLLLLEANAREAGSLSELQFLIANETRKLVSARQVLVHRGEAGKSGWRIEKASSIASIDRNAPMLCWLHDEILSALRSARKSENPDTETSAPVGFRLDTALAPGGTYPFTHCLHIPFVDRNGITLGGMTLLSDRQFAEPDVLTATRFAATYGHAWSALKPASRSWQRLVTKRNAIGVLMAVIAAGFIPVPLTVLAPVEIVARDPVMVAAPLEGVIEEVLVEPNSEVKKGDLLFRYNATNLKSRFELAQRSVAVASARFQRASQSSFGSGDGRRELAITQAEYEVAVAERDFAAVRFAMTRVTAAAGGVVLFTSRQDWTGKPVVTGERVMRLADPGRSEFRIDLAVSDSIMLEADAKVRIFLDSDPLNPVDARIIRLSYQATKSEQEMMVFPLVATLVPEHENNAPLRIGLRGTAQVYGQSVPLAFNLFRKPISAIRQFLGI